MAALSAQTWALQVNEVLDAIFAMSTRGTLASCSRVCRGWEPLANRALWQDLEEEDLGMVPLVKLLAPLEVTSLAERVVSAKH